jgi:putative hydrolase of the HAD superfamily
MDTIDAILFDLGGVFINIDYQATIEAFEKLGFNNAEQLYSQSEQALLFEKYEIGEISTPHFINNLLTISNSKISPNQVVKAWNSMIGDFSIKSIAVLKNLQKKYKLFMLSNTNDLHTELVKRKWQEVENTPFDSYFEKIHFSHQLGMRKPYPETFLKVCDINFINPKKTLFIDDSIQHIEGAEKAGLQTIHLKKIADLSSVLNAYGIN